VDSVQDILEAECCEESCNVISVWIAASWCLSYHRVNIGDTAVEEKVCVLSMKINEIPLKMCGE